MNKLKIKFKTITRSTKEEPAILNKKILLELDKPGYRVIEQTSKSINFIYNTWRFGSRGETFRRVDGGIFSVVSEQKLITLDFYVSPLFEIISTLVVIFFGITENYHIFFFLIFIAVMFVVQLVNAQATANQMMDNILGVE